MYFLYNGGGAADVTLDASPLSEADWNDLRNTIGQLLKARNHDAAARAFMWTPFQIFAATNGFNDEFFVLHAILPVQEYARVAVRHNGAGENPYAQISKTLGEFGYFVRFIGVTPLPRPDAKIVAAPALDDPSDLVRMALQDAQQLLATSGPASAVDRLHTALHAFVRDLATKSGATLNPQAPLPQVFKALCSHHPALKTQSGHRSIATRILHSLTNAVDILNNTRNTRSLAHPTDSIIGTNDAILCINATRTILQYISTLEAPSVPPDDIPF